MLDLDGLEQIDLALASNVEGLAPINFDEPAERSPASVCPHLAGLAAE